jgi:lipopolysaccharide/colanic/teichoic acid biosynthesis glycosyltransferase
MNKKKLYERLIKRILDIILSGIAIVVLAPVFIIISIIIKIKLGSPIIFKQQRVGLNNKIFTMYKFRTMNNNKKENGEFLSDAERLTKLGSTLRHTSADELPQLFNIIKGDMSFIGPRPLVTLYLSKYSPAQLTRHNVRPGLVSLASVNGRNSLTWDQKFAYDIEYVAKISFFIDCKIFLKAFFVVFARRGVTKEGYATSDDFNGKED